MPPSPYRMKPYLWRQSLSQPADFARAFNGDSPSGRRPRLVSPAVPSPPTPMRPPCRSTQATPATAGHSAAGPTPTAEMDLTGQSRAPMPSLAPDLESSPQPLEQVWTLSALGCGPRRHTSRLKTRRHRHLSDRPSTRPCPPKLILSSRLTARRRPVGNQCYTPRRRLSKHHLPKCRLLRRHPRSQRSMVRSLRIRIQGAVLSLCAVPSARWAPVAQPSQRLKSRHDDPDPRHSIPQDHGHPQRRHPLLLSHPWSRTAIAALRSLGLIDEPVPDAHSLPPALGTAGDSPTAHRFRPSIPTAPSLPGPHPPSRHVEHTGEETRSTPGPADTTPASSDGQANPREACYSEPRETTRAHPAEAHNGAALRGQP